MTLYLSPELTPAEVRKAKESGKIVGESVTHQNECTMNLHSQSVVMPSLTTPSFNSLHSLTNARREELSARRHHQQ
jgi:dihydroorotase